MCDDDGDVELVFELKPTREQEVLATRLMLPPTFFCYKNRPGYVSDDDNDGKICTQINTVCFLSPVKLMTKV